VIARQGGSELCAWYLTCCDTAIRSVSGTYVRTCLREEVCVRAGDEEEEKETSTEADLVFLDLFSLWSCSLRWLSFGEQRKKAEPILSHTPGEW